ncbi:DUF6153 family protein [Streptomyces sp. ME02-8801-2C]|uniref:DUF6153 family protein n=1 Tax=Streptomyces sp. ME02-8801-2C TaxID=3028680 RepID=UPI0029AC42D9|nr:DUF6153 family protein [Streptomyces sp. ME02-8801-2C]MDX3457450.1 DUF6153 family protein [Streptomyces sp. ME02-8801-2C]
MTARAQRQQRTHRRFWWVRAFVVLGLLAGVLAMHGLGPGGMPAGTTDASHHGVQAQQMSMSMRAGPADESVCHGMGSHGGHTQHADATCASGAVPAGHTLPALVPDPAGASAPAARGGHSLPRSPEGARAPPSLAELQLLRI